MAAKTCRQLVEAYYTAFNSKNYSLMLELVDPEVHHEVNEGELKVGKEIFSRFLVHMEKCYDETLEEMQFFESGDAQRCAVEFYVRGKYLQTDGGLPEAHGQTYHIRAGAFFESRGERITRVTTYYNLKQWIDLVR